MVCVERKLIPQASEELGIGISTAKYILKCWKKKGKVMFKFDGQKKSEQDIEA